MSPPLVGRHLAVLGVGEFDMPALPLPRDPLAAIDRGAHGIQQCQLSFGPIGKPLRLPTAGRRGGGPVVGFSPFDPRGSGQHSEQSDEQG
ncbi:hypothetical protein [Nocardia transvalensis]|uniref:hypothetical protein n=1 Tax=Nocardia transvalensis TaxID=37333 RepID=UPI001895538B|nr:hypothetical protein [Nocardia transvalensis]MBF6333516.1 hypothetical protein [Nocardia transvalensis]